jgi:TonB-dependent starch-binding outer membrane protein SusC
MLFTSERIRPQPSANSSGRTADEKSLPSSKNSVFASEFGGSRTNVTPDRGHWPNSVKGPVRASITFFLTVWALIGIASIAHAQGVGTITGRVSTEETLRPISAAQVFLVGSQIGSLTNNDGRFQLLNVPAGEYQLRVERIGMRPAVQPVTVQAGATVTVDVSMREQALVLDQVIVTGTAGGARQREVGNAINVISRANAPDVPVSMETMLQAQAPGMTVLQGSGQIGGAAQIRLRGNVSATMSNQPLIYVDGVRIRSEPYPNPSRVGRRSNNENHSPLNDINPADIDRIEIIKGAAASTLYGTEAAAGVIQIFTKRGASGQARWTADVQQGFQRLQPFAPEPTPYFHLDPWLKQGWQQQYNLSVQGGGEALSYFVSGSVEDREGVLPNESLDRKSVRGNFSFSPMRGLNLLVTNFISTSEISNVAGGVNPSGFIMAVMRQKANHLSSADPDDISKLLDQEFLSNIDRMNGGITATYSPTTFWSHRLTIGYDRADNLIKRLRPYGFVLEPRGDLNLREFSTTQATVDYSTTVDFPITPALSTSLSVGGQFVNAGEHTIDGFSLNFPGPTNPTLSTGSITSVSEERLRVLTGGYFAQNLLRFHDRLFLTTGLRIDGSSAFGSGFGLQAYPKVSASYVVHEESFWNDRWGELKLRFAYGTAGRAPGAFDALRTWNPVGWGTFAAYVPQNLGNPDLGPERTLETEFGFDSSILGGRVLIDFTHFRGRTTNALFPVRSIPSTGFQTSQLKNVGELQNQGIELAVNWQVLNGERFNWSLGTNVATNHSKVLSLGEATPLSLGNFGWLIEGEPLMVIRGVKLLNPDEIADPRLELDHIFGPNTPTRIVGLHSSLQLPGQITLSARGEYQGGHYMWDGSTEDAASRAITSWPTCIAANELRSAGRGNELTAKDRLRCDSRLYRAGTHIQRADFFKVRDITARFGVPFRIPGASSAFVTLSASNWIRWVNEDFPIFEPEVMGASEPGIQRVRALGMGVTPPPATFMGSLRLVF